MDPEISDRIFRRSVELHNMQCTENYGDGESESFSRVQDVCQDSGITVEKNEYIGHVQKRLAQHFASWSAKTQAWEEEAS